MNPFLFVYGTLRLRADNEFAQYLHRNADFIGEGRMPGKLFDLGAYSAALFDEDAGRWIEGDVFKLHDVVGVLSVLDEYEGIGPDYPMPQEYIRVEKPIQLHGKLINCWVYLYNTTTST